MISYPTSIATTDQFAPGPTAKAISTAGSELIAEARALLSCFDSIFLKLRFVLVLVEFVLECSTLKPNF